MPENCFVTADTDRLELINGHWIEVKHELSYRERKRAQGALMRRGTDGELELAVENAAIQRILIWAVDWSLTDGCGNVLPIDYDTVGNLKEAIAEEITDLIIQHEKVLHAELQPATVDGEIERHRKAIAELEAAKNALTPGESRPS